MSDSTKPVEAASGILTDVSHLIYFTQRASAPEFGGYLEL